jgi:hypothetical protein
MRINIHFMNVSSYYGKKKALSRENLKKPLLLRLIAGIGMLQGLDERATIFPLTARVWTVTPFKDSMMFR